MAGVALAKVDTAWLRMEDPTNLMMITGVMVFGAPIEFERLRATIESGLLCFDRFRQRAVEPLTPLGHYAWQEDPDLDIDYHLQRATLPAPGDQAALQELASLLSSRQLDLGRPLWQIHLVGPCGPGCALIVRLHHSLADGIALVHVLLSLADRQADSPWPRHKAAAAVPHRHHPLRAVTGPARRTLRAGWRLGGGLLREGARLSGDPSYALDLARLGARGATALGRLLFIPPDPRTALKGKLQVSKQVAWSQPLPVVDVKAVGRSLGGTINDVLLTATTGALRRYLQDRDQPVEGLKIRAVVPVDLRPPGTESDLGNRFGLVFLPLPVGIAEPAARLQELRRRMDKLKGSLEAPVAFGILYSIGALPQFAQDVVVDIFGTKATAVVTNVIGPREKIYLAGAPLEALMFWVPQSGKLGLGVSILSYAGRVWLGVITDAGLVPDPEAIIDGFHHEFAELWAAAVAGEATA
jgi:diacylglycerol O-acyltransferase / wax synthase